MKGTKFSKSKKIGKFNTGKNKTNKNKKPIKRHHITYTEIQPTEPIIDDPITISDLDNLMKENNIISYNPVCVRKKSNWSKLNKKYIFDNPEFSTESLLNDIPEHSPKLQILLNKIEELDEYDMKNHGKLFKHFIFSDLKNGNYGAKLLASALIAKGFNMGYSAKSKPEDNKKKYDKIQFLSDENLLKTPGQNFHLLSSTTVFDQPISVDMKKNILKSFNQRPENIQGQLVRIIVMDSGFKEGIDLFDIKYIHIFEPSVVASDQKQVIGRGTRTCGQKGLEFNPKSGWPLDVFIYDISFPKEIQKTFLGVDSAIDLYLKSKNINVRLYHFANALEDISIYGAVDFELNRNIHTSINSKKQIVDEDKDNHFNNDRKNIRENYSEFTWKPIEIENLCVDKEDTNTTNKGGSPSGKSINFTPSQDFIRNYFTPMNPSKGLLLWWSVGTGKTCAAISSATSSFEKQGYTILWVTRTTLKNDIWKNMFEQVCNESIRYRIQNEGLTIPDDPKKRMKLLSKSWRIRPISYKQFSNLVSKQNSYYRKLEKINGNYDPLHKTLLIIDEAHKLYGGDDLSSIERPDMDALRNSIMHSYEVSGEESVRLLLMSATPITNSPMELIKLINLCKSRGEQLPDNFDDFSNQYLDDSGKFTNKGKTEYLNSISGNISYLNRERDLRQFAQPILHNVLVPITNNIDTAKRFDKKLVRDMMESNSEELKMEITEKIDELDGEIGDLDRNKFNFLKTEICGDLEGKPLKECERVVRDNIRKLVAEIKDKSSIIRKEIKDIREQLKLESANKKKLFGDIRENIEKYKNEYDEYKGSQIYALKKHCGNRINNMSDLKIGLMNDHPIFIELNNKIREHNDKIRGLNDKMKDLIDKHKNRVKYLRNLSKSGLNDLEKNVVLMTIRDEEKEYKEIMKLQNADNNKTVKNYNKEVKKLEKTRSKKYNKFRKTVRKMIQTKKQEEREAKKDEKDLRKTLRKEGQYREEIKNDIIKELVSKYQEKILNELVDLDQAKLFEEEEKERKKEEKREQKEKIKTDKKELNKTIKKREPRENEKGEKTPKQTTRKRTIELYDCSSSYVLKDSDNNRKNELKVMKGQQLRDILSTLRGESIGRKNSPGAKNLDELIRLIICLENKNT